MYRIFPSSVLHDPTGLLSCGLLRTNGNTFGQIYNLRGSGISADAVILRWDWEAFFDGQADRIMFATYVDGVFYASTYDTFQIVGNLTNPNGHSVEIFAVSPDLAENVTWANRNNSARVRLSWVAGASNDTARYDLFSNAGNGSVSFDSTFAVVNKIEATHLEDADASEIPFVPERTLWGTITSSGNYTGSLPYVDYYIVIDGNGETGTATYKYSIDNGSTWLNEHIVTQDYPVLMDSGIALQFNGDNYEVGDGWHIIVACRSYYDTPNLANGSWVVVPRAVDSVGNSTTNVFPEMAFSIGCPPPVLSGLSLSYSNETRLATITWTATTATDIVNIYHNGGDVTMLAPDFYEPVDTSSSNAGTWTSSALTAGTWLFCLRTMNEYGESEDLTYIQLVLSGDPPVFTTIADPPLSASASSSSGGDVTLSMQMLNNAYSVNVYGDATTGTIDYGTLLATISFSASELVQSSFWHSETITQATLGAGDGTYKLALRSVSSSGVEETTGYVLSDVVSDATPPDVPTEWAVTVL